MKKKEFKEALPGIIHTLENNTKNTAKKAAEVAVKGGKEVVKKVGQVTENIKRTSLAPVFLSDIETGEFALPAMIQIIEYDKQHMDAEVCKGSIGFETKKGTRVLNLYRKDLPKLDLRFYPEIAEDIYYVDPYDKNLYISLNEYFDYLRKARVSELTTIAQDLGAKHLKVTIVTEKKVFVSKKVNTKLKVPKVIDGNLDTNKNQTGAEKRYIAADTTFDGRQEAIEPKLKYFKNEEAINKLIESRLHTQNPLATQTLSFGYNRSSGIKEKDAVKIDVALKQMKLGGNTNISSEVQEEKRMTFEYQIEF